MRLPSEVIPIRERRATFSVRYGKLDVEDGAFVLVDAEGVRLQIPIGGITCLMLEPGVTVTHAAVALAPDSGTLLLWVGEEGGRVYSAGRSDQGRTDRLIRQARASLDEDARTRVVRAMYAYRFQSQPPERRTIEQMRGIEGARVRTLYQTLARQYGLKWERRSYDVRDWNRADPLNKALSVANHCLYGITEAAILTAGYSPAFGFIHRGKPLSFVYDIADLFKFTTVVPVAFATIAKGTGNIGHDVRTACRDVFRKNHVLDNIIPVIEQMLDASGLPLTDAQADDSAPRGA